jgi:Uma2 family endonuclease
MPTITFEELEIPFEVRTLDGFREWYAALPERAPRIRASFFDGNVTIEVGQSYDTHEPVITSVSCTLAGLASERAGRYFTPSSWITSKQGGFSTEPDGFFALYETLKSGALRFDPRRPIELIGRPDFVLEVVSESSRRKDLVDAVAGYARAGIPEYWIIDATRKRLVFRVLVLEGAEYVDVEADARGWRASPTWERSFKLRRSTDPAGMPAFRLEVR